MSNWSDLPYDLLVSVGKRLNLLEDYLNLSRVCKSWRSAATKHNFCNDLNRVPWLMLAEETEDNSSSCRRQFFSLYNGMMLNKTLPEARGKRCMHSMGWLFTVGKDKGETSLLHPFSRIQIELPHQKTTKDYKCNRTSDLWTFFHKAVLSASPSHTSDFVLMVIEGGMGWLSFWMPGDLRWTRITKKRDHASVRDVVFFNGKFYAIDARERILVCDVAGPEPTQTQIIAQLPTDSDSWGDAYYIVESLGTLFVIVRDGGMVRCPRDDNDRIPLTSIHRFQREDNEEANDGVEEEEENEVEEEDAVEEADLEDEEEVEEDEEEEVEEDEEQEEEEKELTYGTTDFRVFELDLASGQLTETKNIGDKAFFLGHSASVSVQASEFPGIKPNHIYFTDDYFESYMAYEEGGGLDMGVFSLADDNIEQHYKGVSLSRVCPPIWVTPTPY